jgi:uncharacterized protein YgbK (DUF1537 family)
VPALSVLVLADDLTGALEAGAKLSGCGIPATVTTRLQWEAAQTPALVVDTETRHSTPAEAAAIVRQALRQNAQQLIYKKTDSTLRGNIGAELDTMLSACRGSPLIYVPAYPKMGRTVRDGCLLVDGVPVHQTAFARDPLNPIHESYIPTILKAQCRAPIHNSHTVDDPSIHLVDAETDEDVARAAQALVQSKRPWCAAGPAAFLEAIAHIMDFPRVPPPCYPNVRRCLLVNGSIHEQALRQVEFARATGWQTVTPGDAPAAPLRWVILDPGPLPSQGVARARCLGQVVRGLVERGGFDTVLVFGGDTAFGIILAMGNPDIHPYREIVAGVPFSTLMCGGRELNLITKAGGFGVVDILTSIRNLL